MSQLLEGGVSILSGDRAHFVMKALTGGELRIKKPTSAERRPRHGADAILLTLIERAIKERLHVQQAELNLIGDKWLCHPAVEEIKLVDVVIGNPGAADFAFLEQFVQSLCGVVGAGQPIRPMHEEKINLLDAEETE
jgi:hypothetical protein